MATTHEEPLFDETTFDTHTLEIEWNFIDTSEKEVMKGWAKTLKPPTFIDPDEILTEDMNEQLADEASREPTEEELMYILELQEKSQ